MTLTSRQREVLALLARSWSEKRIAGHLHVSSSAVKAIASRIRKQMAVPHDASIAAAALMYQIVGRADLDPRRLEYLFAAAPISVVVFRGPRHIVELINDEGCRHLGGRAVAGRPVREAFPEPDAKVLIEILDDVYESGTRHVGHAVPVRWPSPDGRREGFVDFVVEATRDVDGGVDGLIAFAIEATASVHAQQRASQGAGRDPSLASRDQRTW